VDYSPSDFETASGLAFGSFPSMDLVAVSSLQFLASDVGSTVPMGQMSVNYSQVGLVDQPHIPPHTLVFSSLSGASFSIPESQVSTTLGTLSSHHLQDFGPSLFSIELSLGFFETVAGENILVEPIGGTSNAIVEGLVLVDSAIPTHSYVRTSPTPANNSGSCPSTQDLNANIQLASRSTSRGTGNKRKCIKSLGRTKILVVGESILLDEVETMT
jgi:hypothetical protein